MIDTMSVHSMLCGYDEVEEIVILRDTVYNTL